MEERAVREQRKEERSVEQASSLQAGQRLAPQLLHPRRPMLCDSAESHSIGAVFTEAA